MWNVDLVSGGLDCTRGGGGGGGWCFFFFNDTATTEIYTLSLHDALPILQQGGCIQVPNCPNKVLNIDHLKQ